MEKHHDTILAEIKREFYTFRNGIVTDALRKQGSPYKFIFGLNLPQISEIALRYDKSAELGMLLLGNATTRESQLMAAMVYPDGLITTESALKWIGRCVSQEAVDVFCLKQLRDKTLANEIISLGKDSDNDLTRYAVLRLIFRNLPDNMDEAELYAKKELGKDCPVTRFASNQLINEIAFIKSE